MSRRALVLVLAASLAAPVGASAAPKPPVLAGTVRITATAPAVIDVRLPKAVDFRDGYMPPKGMVVAGDGRVAGVLLLDAKGGFPRLELVQFGLCATAGCKPYYPKTFFHATDGVAPYGEAEKLPAGDYRLAVVTDGRPVTVVLKFAGLKGTLNLKPTRLIHVRHDMPDYTAGTGQLPAHGVATGSAAISVDGGQGILLHQFKADTEGTVQQHGGFCVYTESVPEPAPKCPGGKGGEINLTRVHLDKARWTMVGRYGYLEEGGYRAGSFYRTIGVAKAPLGVVTTVVLPPR